MQPNPGQNSTKLILESEMIDPLLHKHVTRDMRVSMASAPRKDVLGRQYLAPFSQNGIVLSIQEFQQSQYHTYFLYGDNEPEMVDFENCVVCETKILPVSCLTDKRGKRYLTYALCPCCGFFQHSRRPPKEFYPEFYGKMWDPNKRAEDSWPKEVPPQMDPLNHAYLYLKRGGKILEIGTGWGQFILGFKVNGFECYGIEAGEHRARFVEERLGIPVWRGAAENAPIGEGFFQEESFDMFVSNHVLEHVYDTREVLSHLYPLLKPNGLAYICIPNFYQENLTCNTHDLSHTCSFSYENFILMVESLGFELVKDVSDLVNVSVLLRKCPKASKEHLESKKKWLGEFLPHRGLAYILEKNGLGFVPKNLSVDLNMKMTWVFPPPGKPPEPYISLRFDVLKEYGAMIDELRAAIRERRDLRSIASLLPIQYVYPSEGVPIWYY